MRTSIFLLSLVATLGFATGSRAQNPYVLVLEDASGPPGGTADVGCFLDSSLGEEVQAWSFSVCHDSTLVRPVDTTIGSAALNLNGGQGPDFFFSEATPAGVHSLAMVSIVGAAALPPGFSEVLRISYFLDAPSPNTAEIEYCDTVGDPPTVTLLAVNQMGVVPDVTPGEVDIVGAPLPQEFVYTAPDVQGNFDPATGIGSITVRPIVEQTAGPTGLTTGFSMGLEHDPDVLLAVNVSPAGPVADLNGGSGPFFFGAEILTDGITVDIVYSPAGSETISFNFAPAEVIEIQYDTNAPMLQGVMTGVTTELIWSDGLGAPPVPNEVIIDTVAISPGFQNGEVGLNLTDFFLRIPDQQGPNGGQVETSVLLDNSLGAAGWSLGVCHDSAFVEVSSIAQGATTMTINGGDPPSFYTDEILPGEGWFAAAVVDFFGSFFVPPGIGWELNTAVYDLLGPDGSETSLDFCDTLGNPMVQVLITDITGVSNDPATLSGLISIESAAPEFIRGDVNGDGSFNGLVDGLFILNFQFVPGSPAPPCDDAADADDSGTVNGLVDGLLLLNFQFVAGSPPPPAPGPDTCGPDPTADGLECLSPPCP